MSSRCTHGRSKIWPEFSHPERSVRTPTARAPCAPPRRKTEQPLDGCGAPVDMPDEQQRRPVAHGPQHEEEGVADLRARPGRSWAGCAPRKRGRLLVKRARPCTSGPPAHDRARATHYARRSQLIMHYPLPTVTDPQKQAEQGSTRCARWVVGAGAPSACSQSRTRSA